MKVELTALSVTSREPQNLGLKRKQVIKKRSHQGKQVEERDTVLWNEQVL